jgi:pimeloyl-ACP methyl ester carboxylesterase
MLATRLARYGFIAVIVDSPDLGRVEYPDGRTVEAKAAFRPPPGLMARPYSEVDAFFSEAAELGAADLARVVDAIPAEINQTTPLTLRISADRFALVGHSLGARSAGLYASRDRRVAAYVAFEGVPPPQVRKEGLDAASLMMVGADFPPSAEVNVLSLADQKRSPYIFVRVANATHNSITDTSATSASPKSREAHECTIDLVVQFLLTSVQFDKRDLACAHPSHITKLIRK